MQKQSQQQTPISYQVYSKNYQQRIALRNINLDRNNLPAQRKAKISQIKTIQKFIGKLKVENKNNESILTEMQGLNLKNYLQEISSLIANCINEKQIRFYSSVVTKLNQEYQDFPGMIIKDLVKQFNNLYEIQEDNKVKLKALFLFTTELYVCGLAFPYKEINEMLKKFVKAGTKKKTNFNTEKEMRLFAYYYNCDSYASFLINFGAIFTSSLPRWVNKWRKEGKEIWKFPQIIPTKSKQDITNIFFPNYITSCSAVLQSAFEKIKEVQGQLRENLRMSGEFNKSTEINYNELKEKFIFTKKNLEIIINSINYNLVLKDYEKEMIQVEDIMKKYINKVDNVELFENQFEKQLYLELPEFCKTQNKSVSQEEYKEFKEKLQKCKNKVESDEIVKFFQGINNKRTRKLLAKDILQYRKEYQLVTPFLCRIAAIVAQNFKDILQPIVDYLFLEYQKLRDNINTNFVVNDKRSRNLKYICQFTKFKVIESDKAINCIQNLIDDLKGYNIQLLIMALENVGRFLYLSPNNANKFTFLLSKLENVMKQKAFALFTTSQLLNSINLLKPHIQVPKTFKPEPTKIELEAQKIISRDIIQELEVMMEEIRQFIKKEGGMQAIKIVLIKQIESYDFLRNYNYVYLINELENEEIIEYCKEQTIKKLQEAIKLGNYQSCLLWSRFFGQLFKYHLIKRIFLFEKLSSFLRIQGANEISLINIVCTVLQTCQSEINCHKLANSNRKFLFLVQFKKFIHKCSYIQMLEQFKIIDIFDQLQPNLTAIKIDVLDNFLKQNDKKKDNKDFDYSKKLDRYLDQRHPKDNKKEVIQEIQDPRQKQSEMSPESEVEKVQENTVFESKQFDSEFTNLLTSHMKDLSGKLAKPMIVQKQIQRKKDKRKPKEGDKKIVVIARNGNKFTKKDIFYHEEVSKKNNGVQEFRKEQ